MKTIISVLILVVVVGGGYLLLKDSVANMPQNQNGGESYQTLTDEEVGLKFDYRESPDGYVLQNLNMEPADSLPDPHFIKGYQLMLESEYEELQASTEPREGPPTISVVVFENTLNQSASVWVDENPIYSNIGLARGEVDRDAVLAGANAVRYTYDGLYTNDGVVVAHGGLIYMFSGSYLSEDSVIKNDYQPFLNSVEFIQISGQE